MQTIIDELIDDFDDYYNLLNSHDSLGLMSHKEKEKLNGLKNKIGLFLCPKTSFL